MLSESNLENPLLMSKIPTAPYPALKVRGGEEAEIVAMFYAEEGERIGVQLNCIL